MTLNSRNSTCLLFIPIHHRFGHPDMAQEGDYMILPWIRSCKAIWCPGSMT